MVTQFHNIFLKRKVLSEHGNNKKTNAANYFGHTNSLHKRH